MAEKLWDGRFSEATDSLVERFTSSIDYDRRLYAHDIRGSVAHATMMAAVGVLTDAERDSIIQGLGQVKEEIERGDFTWSDALEDIHMHVESRLVELIGDTGKKIHTGRSRNDQVATDIRLWLRDEVNEIMALLSGLRRTLVELADTHIDLVLPGYTHLQRAQPVLLAHHLMAYQEMFSRDEDRMRDCLGRINVLPLGSAALAGTAYPIDRELTARLLGFPAISANSMDAVADRDFVVEFLSAASLCMVHFSRLSEELILWSSQEYGFVVISDAFTTGSSIMPQKKNPDVCELTRGKTGRVVGSLMALLMLLKSLPMAYNRDMQEDKEPLFDGVDTLKATLAIYTRMLSHMEFRGEVMANAAETGFLNATDMADYLVNKGMPFREAHSVAGKAVARALDQGIELHHLSLDVLRELTDIFDEDIYDFLTVSGMISRRKSAGATAREQVKSAISAARASLEIKQPAGQRI
ncbi:MAG: argininosuccinate lyase [Desulfobacterales bacterium]|nr:MAG: argininosuccinate lyase [Desulfobacterales bacterium]